MQVWLLPSGKLKFGIHSAPLFNHPKSKSMKKLYFSLAALSGVVVIVAAFTSPQTKKPIAAAAIQSISAITFSPDGILFIGDSKGATVFAAATKDKKQNAPAEIKNIDKKIAAALGTDVANITITDIAVNPVSKQLYIAVQTKEGDPVLMKLEDGTLQSVSLKDLASTSTALNNAPAEDAKDNRGRSLRVSSITDLGYADGKVLVSGLSNHEFSSSLKSIPYPFTAKQDETTLEIYHAAHGRYETTAPVKTFTTATINNKKYIVASYTCTPLVLFPIDELKPGTHVKGRTVAEMGSGNTPVDMFSVGEGKDAYLVIANTRYPLAKVDYKNLAAFEGTLTAPVQGTAGVAFTATKLTNVLQMDKVDNKQVVMIQKKENGDVDLFTTNEGTF